VSSPGPAPEALSRERIVDAVLGASRAAEPRKWSTPVALAAAAHLAVVLLAPRERSGEQWALATALRVRDLLAAQEARPIDLPRAPASSAEPEPEPQSQPTRERPPAAARSPERLKAQPPAKAGNALVRAPASSEPVDFGDNLAVGAGSAYAGGATTSAGTSAETVEGPVSLAPKPPPEPAAEAPDLSRPVALADPDWTCPWPREADDAQIDEQEAVVRVVVGPEGRGESASVVQDPGFGFGAQAARCAMDADFLPAHDRSGRPARATSSIRVRFMR
jgi:protein TonB